MKYNITKFELLAPSEYSINKIKISKPMIVTLILRWSTYCKAILNYFFLNLIIQIIDY